MNNFLESKKKEISLDLTSLIDIIFLLLIFFMVTTTFDKFGGAKIELPKSQLKEVKNEDIKLMLLIDNEKKLSIKINSNGAEKSFSTNIKKIDNDLKNIITNSGEKTLSILSDKKIEYGYIISVIEKAKLSGIEKINLETISN